MTSDETQLAINLGEIEEAFPDSAKGRKTGGMVGKAGWDAGSEKGWGRGKGKRNERWGKSEKTDCSEMVL